MRIQKNQTVINNSFIKDRLKQTLTQTPDMSAWRTDITDAIHGACVPERG